MNVTPICYSYGHEHTAPVSVWRDIITLGFLQLGERHITKSKKKTSASESTDPCIQPHYQGTEDSSTQEQRTAPHSLIKGDIEAQGPHDS